MSLRLSMANLFRLTDRAGDNESDKAGGRAYRMVLRAPNDRRHQSRPNEYRVTTIRGIARINATTNAASSSAMRTESPSVTSATVRSSCHRRSLPATRCSTDGSPARVAKMVTLYEIFDMGVMKWEYSGAPFSRFITPDQPCGHNL